MRYFSLFSGIGGFEKGIQQACEEVACVGYSEIDKYAIQIYERHFKHKMSFRRLWKRYLTSHKTRVIIYSQ